MSGGSVHLKPRGRHRPKPLAPLVETWESCRTWYPKRRHWLARLLHG